MPVLQKLREMIAHELEEQRLLVSGVKVQRTRLHPDLARDLAHGDRGKPVPCKKPQCCRPDLWPRDVPVTSLFTCHGSTLSERVFNSTVADAEAALCLDSDPAIGLAQVMGRSLVICVLFGSVLTACGPDVPALDARIGAEARSADFPELVPLGPILASVDTTPLRAASTEGQSLEARTADLRRRAAALRAIPL